MSEKIRTNLKDIFLPLAVFIFSVVFGIFETLNRNATLDLTESNIELAESKIKVSLIPFLTSQNSEQRKIALLLASALDPKFAAEVGPVLSKSDPDSTVRVSATNTLFGLLSNPQEDIQELAKEGISQTEIMNELRKKNLLVKLIDAQGYIDGGGPNGIDKALELYHSVIDQLSANAINNLDQNLLSEARQNYEKGSKDLAVRTYRQLFSDYR